MGMFGVGEIIANLEHEETRSVMIKKRHGPDADARGLASASSAPILRGTALGSVLGILPGGGAMLASFAAYALEKKVSKNPAQFGKGAIEGVAGARGRQQRRRADLVHPDADARHPVQPGDGADDRRA